MLGLEANEKALLAGKIFPSIISFDTAWSQKTVEGKIILFIGYGSSDEDARILEKSIVTTYRSGIKGTPYTVKVIPYKEIIFSRSPYGVVIITDYSHDLTAVIAAAKRYNALTFALNNEGLDSGALVGLSITSRVTPLINPRSPSKNTILFSQGFINIAKVYAE